MSLLLLFASSAESATVFPDERGVYLPAHNATLILEVSTAPALAEEQVWLDASGYLVNRAGQLEGVVEWEHGRDSETDSFREGALTVLLDNTGGAFDRRNTASPFHDALRSRRQIRLLAHRGKPGNPIDMIEVEDGDGPYPGDDTFIPFLPGDDDDTPGESEGLIVTLFRGFVRGWPRHYGLAHQFSWVTVQAFDGFRILGEAGLDDAGFTLDDDVLGRLDVGRLAGDNEAVELSGTRIDALADIAGWPASLRSIDPGLVKVGEDDATSPLDAMRQAEAAEAGYLRIDRQGRLTFNDRLSPWTKERQTTTQATFGGEFGLKLFDVDGIGPDATRIRNDVRRTGLSGVVQSADDPASIYEYGHLEDEDDVIAVHDDDVAGIAALRLAAQSAEIERLDELTIEATVHPGTLYRELMDRELLDRITVELTEPYGETNIDDWIIQKIRQRVTASSWRGTFRLAPAIDLALFTLDDDTAGLLDGDTVLAP